MNLGLYFDLRNPRPWDRPWSEVYGSALELCEEADRLGAHSVWFSEHHLFDDGYLPQPLTFAAAAAGRTREIRLGTAILIAPLRPAAQIAEESALVDTISGGRLDLGIGAGYRRPEYELFEADGSQPLGRLFERARSVRLLFDEGGITPGPVQDPFQLWIGCNGPVGARKVGQIGERLLSVQPAAVEAYREGLAEAGLDPLDYPTSGPVGLFLSDDPERDWASVGRYFAYQWDSYAQAAAEGTGKLPPPPMDPEIARARGLAGGLRGCLVTTADDAIKQLQAHFDHSSVETLFTWSWLPGVPDELVARHIELLTTRVAPALSQAW